MVVLRWVNTSVYVYNAKFLTVFRPVWHFRSRTGRFASVYTAVIWGVMTWDVRFHRILRIYKKILKLSDRLDQPANRISSLAKVIHIDIDGRTQKVRRVGSWVLQANNVVDDVMAGSLDKP